MYFGSRDEPYGRSAARPQGGFAGGDARLIAPPRKLLQHLTRINDGHDAPGGHRRISHELRPAGMCSSNHSTIRAP